MPSDGFDRDTRHPLTPHNYQYGDRQAELEHAYREIEQYQLALTDEVISQRDYEKGVASVRRRHGLLGWGASFNGP